MNQCFRASFDDLRRALSFQTIDKKERKKEDSKEREKEEEDISNNTTHDKDDKRYKYMKNQTERIWRKARETNERKRRGKKFGCCFGNKVYDKQ